MTFSKKISGLLILLLCSLLYAQEDITLNLIVRFGDVKLPSSYRMIGLPGNSEISVGSVLTGEFGKDWVAFADNGSGNLVSFTDNTDEDFILSQGKALWILSKDNLIIENLESPAANMVKEFVRITLHPGWNMITNPLDSSISWESVQKQNDLNDRIYYFKDGRYITNSVKFEPYLGYYFFNRYNLDYLEIPVKETSGIYKSDYTEYDTVKVIVSSDNIVYDEFVVLTGSNVTQTNITQYSPPDNFSSVSIYSEAEGNKVKEIILNPGNDPVNIILKNTLPDAKIDIKKSNNSFGKISLTDQYGIDITNSKVSTGEHYYKLYISEKGNDDIIPDRFEISNPYPNPFNPETNFRLMLTESKDISYRIYDSLGREVFKSGVQNYQPGYHSVSVDMNGFSSGVYYYMFFADNKDIKSGKLILLK